MPFKDPAKRRKFHRETMRYRRALAAGEPFALAAEEARKRAENSMREYHALSPRASPAETQRVHAACNLVRDQETRKYRELRAAVASSGDEPAPDARQTLRREIRRLRAALEQATAELRAMDEAL